MCYNCSDSRDNLRTCADMMDPLVYNHAGDEDGEYHRDGNFHFKQRGCSGRKSSEERLDAKYELI